MILAWIMLSRGKILMSREHLVETPKITPRAFPAFTFYSKWKQRCLVRQCASVEQWLINHLWCSFTYFQGISFAQARKSSNLSNQWLSLQVLCKPMSFCLADEICARELACCYSRVNELESMNSNSADLSADLSEID
jgi:hypothetical protein